VSKRYFHAMIAEMDQVVSALLGKGSLREMQASELKHLTLQYPYASFMHLLRSRKLKDANDAEYPVSVAMTALYFNNPHWLHQQLQATTPGAMVQEWEKAMDMQGGHAKTVDRRDGNPELSDELVDEAFAGKPEMPLSPEPPAEVPAVISITPEEDAEPVMEEAIEIVTEEALPSAPEVPLEAELAEPEISIEENVITGRLSNILKESVSPEALVPIEPLYTVDYFASVGIRLLADPEQTDQLGTKLKSFTEWLKAMRRIHPEKLEAQMDAGSETRIRKEAEHSNDPAAVVTETMATVFLQQGLKDKAVEVYSKLSLLEPAKSAYFASKINELKA
jgi:hypothetical protein